MRIVDFTKYMPGPLASRILIDLGADVIKVESPRGGDANRGASPYVHGQGLFHVALNAGARSVAMSPRDERWAPLVEACARWADVIMVGGMPNVLDKLGIGFEKLTAINPKLVWCNVTGYGEKGPWRGLASHGLNPDAFAGLVPIEENDGVPDPHGDYQSAGAPLSGVFAALGVLAALRRRDETGEAQRVHASMFGAAIWWNWRHVTALANLDKPWWRYKDFGGRYATYRCSDGGIVLVCPVEKNFWQSFCDLLDLPAEWRERGMWERTVMDHGFNYPEERAVIAERMARMPRDHWVAEFTRINIPFAPILSAMEAIDSEHARENEVMREVDVEGQSARIPSLPVQVVSAGGRSAQEGMLSTPPLGADAKSVFEELGLASLASKDA